MMAEFRDTKIQKEQRASDERTADGMNAFGKPVPTFRKHAALEHCRAMGLDDTNKATGMINRMADAIERDEPYEAMEAGTAYLDLTGAYRVLAVLCVAEQPTEPEPDSSDTPEQEEEAFKRDLAQTETPIAYDEWGF
jgi:hypothetical protein